MSCSLPSSGSNLGMRPPDMNEPWLAEDVGGVGTEVGMMGTALGLGVWVGLFIPSSLLAPFDDEADDPFVMPPGSGSGVDLGEESPSSGFIGDMEFLRVVEGSKVGPFVGEG